MLDYVVIRCRDMCDVKRVHCMHGAECWTDYRLLQANVSLVTKNKMRKCGLKVPKRIDLSQMACGEKLEHFQSAIQAINLMDLVASSDPANIFAKALYKVTANSFGFVSRRHQD